MGFIVGSYNYCLTGTCESLFGVGLSSPPGAVAVVLHLNFYLGERFLGSPPKFIYYPPLDNKQLFFIEL